MSDTAHGKEKSHVQSVERAIRLIEILAEENREMSLTELSKRAGWPKSTTYGLLSTLRDYHYVDQNAENGHYRLGIRLFELGNLVARNWHIRTLAQPVMQRLNNQTGEMIQLAAEDKGEVLYIEKLDSTHMMRIVSDIGARLPMHCTGLGKVLLAYKKPAEVKWILNMHGMAARTKRTITDPARMEKELADIRKKGYAVDDGEIMESLRCIAAPIRDREGDVRYAVSVSGLAGSMTGEHFERVRAQLLKAAEDISYAMGYRAEAES